MTTIAQTCHYFKNLLTETVVLGTKASLLSGMGYGTAFFANHVFQQMNSSYFAKAGTFIDPFNGAICCGIFVIVDLIARAIFEKILGENRAHQPLCVLARIAICIPISVIATGFEGLVLTYPAGYTVILSALVGYVVFLEIAKRYEK